MPFLLTKIITDEIRAKWKEKESLSRNKSFLIIFRTLAEKKKLIEVKKSLVGGENLHKVGEGEGCVKKKKRKKLIIKS